MTINIVCKWRGILYSIDKRVVCRGYLRLTGGVKGAAGVNRIVGRRRVDLADVERLIAIRTVEQDKVRIGEA